MTLYDFRNVEIVVCLVYLQHVPALATRLVRPQVGRIDAIGAGSRTWQARRLGQRWRSPRRPRSPRACEAVRWSKEAAMGTATAASGRARQQRGYGERGVEAPKASAMVATATAAAQRQSIEHGIGRSGP